MTNQNKTEEMFMEKSSRGLIPLRSLRSGIPHFQKFWCVLFLFSILVIPVGMAQDESAIKSEIKGSDLKKLNKADRIKAEADKLMEQDAAIKTEIGNIQRDSNLKERAIKRKIRSLETKSWQIEFQASTLYEKSNNRKYNVYKKYLNRFWKEHEGQESKYLNAKVLEEQARDNYAQASVYRRKTRHMNLGVVKVQKLSEANNLESVAIRKQVTSLQYCLGSPEVAAKTMTPEKPVKQDTVEITAQAPATPKTEPEKKTMVVPAADTSVAPPLVTPPAVTEVIPAKPEEKTEAVSREDVQEKRDRVVFRIQIAASRLPLTFTELAKIYSGKYPIEAVSEGGWLKYQFLGLPMFSDAQKIFRETAVKGAFIVAYRNGIKQNPAEMIKENKELEKKMLAEGKSGLSGEPEYHVVLKVSKVLLKAAEISKIYKGPEPVLLIMEKGLYEYHLDAGNSAERAKFLRQKSGIPEAAIATYRNCIRTDGNGAR